MCRNFEPDDACNAGAERSFAAGATSHAARIEADVF